MFEAWLQSKNSPSNHPPPGPNPTSNTPLLCQGYDDDGKPLSYCHSHGITMNLKHNSKNCIRKKQGHKDEATLQNKLGGCEDRMKPRKRTTQKKWLIGNTTLNNNININSLNVVSAHPPNINLHSKPHHNIVADTAATATFIKNDAQFLHCAIPICKVHKQ